MVQAYDAIGDFPQLLVNTIGAYEGTRPLNLDAEPVREMEITADGSWTATVNPITEADEFTGEAQGSGDSVLIAPDGLSGRLDITHNGEANFVVQAHGNGFPDLLVNEIGSYDGTVRVSGALVLAISADGQWTIVQSG